MCAPVVDLACRSFSYCISNGALGEMRKYIYTQWNGYNCPLTTQLTTRNPTLVVSECKLVGSVEMPTHITTHTHTWELWVLKIESILQ
jgi:hypothetical protein